MTDTTGQDAPQPDSVTQPAAVTRTEVHTLPQDVQDYIKRLNDENATRRKANDTLAQQMQERQDAKLAEEKRWQELAEKRGTEIEQLKTVQEHATGLEATVQSVLDAQLAELPDEARKAIEDMPGNAQQKLDWLAKNRATLTRSPAPNMHAGPRGDQVPPSKALTPEELPAFQASQMSLEDWNKKKEARLSREKGSDLIARLRAQNQE